MSLLKSVLFWIGLWALILGSICLAGAILGGILFPLAGSLMGMDLSLSEMFLNGIKDGGFLAFIWAPGLAFVVCLIYAKKRYDQKRINSPNPLDTQD